MRYLLDVNVLVAWGWSDHVEHHRVVAWIAELKAGRKFCLATASIPQLGFVRVSVQRAQGSLSVREAGDTLEGMLSSLGNGHEFLSDNIPAIQWPDWCRGASQTTDAHLLFLAATHKFRLATLDRAIPGAFLIPVLPK